VIIDFFFIIIDVFIKFKILMGNCKLHFDLHIYCQCDQHSAKLFARVPNEQILNGHYIIIYNIDLKF
jgi:hypothetical protein